MPHQYTVTTPQGDVHLTTERHHSTFSSIEAFLKHHHDAIATALQVTTVAIGALGVYLSHGRSGPKLK